MERGALKEFKKGKAWQHPKGIGELNKKRKCESCEKWKALSGFYQANKICNKCHIKSI